MIFSEDLRKRTIEAVINQKMRVAEVVITFQIGRRTIYTWLTKYRKDKTTAAKTGYQKGPARKIADLEFFKNFVEKKADSSAEEMAVRWEKETNQSVSKSTILRSLQRIGFTPKKKLSLRRSKQRKAVRILKTNPNY